MDSNGSIAPYRADDGAEISVRAFPAPRRPRALLLVAHGMTEHALRYARLAGFLAERGVATRAPDHRGHGLSAGGAAGLGFMAERGGFLRVLADLAGIAEEMRRDAPALPLFVLGHSMGSFLVQGLIARKGSLFSGAVLSGTAGPGNPLLLPGLAIGALTRALRGPRARSPFLASVATGSFNAAFKPARTPFDWLSRDPAEVDAFMRDPLCGYVCSVSYYIDIVEGLRYIHRKDVMARIPRKLPILLASGSEDPVGAAPGTLDRLFEAYRRLGIEDVEKRVYPGARHEILNEINRDEVMADVASWLEARIP